VTFRSRFLCEYRILSCVLHVLRISFVLIVLSPLLHLFLRQTLCAIYWKCKVVQVRTGMCTCEVVMFFLLDVYNHGRKSCYNWNSIHLDLREEDDNLRNCAFYKSCELLVL
jgi:hypothetical protein